MTASANTPVPATPAPRRSFARAGAASTAAAATTPTTPVADAAAETDPAEPEQTNAAEMLVNVDFDAALQHNSDGLHRGEIITAKPTKGGNGIYVAVRHEDGMLASCNFMLFRAIKDDVTKQPVLDAAGKPKMERDIAAQKQWASFCAALGLVPQEVTKAIVDYAAQRSPDRAPIVGLSLMWDFKQNGQFLNCTYNDAATQEMLAAAGA